MDLFERLRAEWPVIKGAPLSVGGLMVVAGTMGFLLAGALYAHELAAGKQEVAAAHADRELIAHQLEEARSQIKGGPPPSADYDAHLQNIEAKPGQRGVAGTMAADAAATVAADTGTSAAAGELTPRKKH